MQGSCYSNTEYIKNRKNEFALQDTPSLSNDLLLRCLTIFQPYRAMSSPDNVHKILPLQRKRIGWDTWEVYIVLYITIVTDQAHKPWSTVPR